MKWMSLNELRESYLSFFESKGHYRLPSFSLVPKDDNSLLLINSGMAPMKKYFMGEVAAPSNRVTTCQKCIRNNDIENVGFTSRHLTFFEMLGNFSFGDYFKEQAIKWAWEFFNSHLGISEEKLHISVYLEDDEAYDIWTKKVGIDPSHMVKLGKEDNFWEHGTGPCGPCSEIYFDRGEKEGCGKPDCAPGCDCDRFVEVGNIVFSQFDSDGKGNYTPLEKPNIDFGMGLERLATVVQGVDNVFQIDSMKEITNHVASISGVEYGVDGKKDVSLRIITDHIKSITFMIGDGILPDNDGRGYVLRRLLRRAARHGKLLGINEPFLTEIADTVINENREAYPELSEKKVTIKKVVKYEEESFARTIDQGLSMLTSFIDGMESGVFSGEKAFLLNDTYGFPLDLTKEILMEKKITVDEESYKRLMQEQRERARNARKNAGKEAWAGGQDAADDLPPTDFVGYSEMECNATVLAVIKSGERIDSAIAGDEVLVVVDVSPFYAESGGQVGDSGEIVGDGVKLEVVDTTKNSTGVYIHQAVVKDGALEIGAKVKMSVNVQRRRDIMRNHTAAHLLQAALRSVLGTHVEQAGQLVDDHRVRFDFTHFAALTPEEIAKTEEMVNGAILDAMDVTVRQMPIEEAKKIGAMALFGEKYGDVVRVVSVEDFSKEFCGGTHVDNTSKLGVFKIVSESSVASGVRRIEGVTGRNLIKLMNNFNSILTQTAKAFKMSSTSGLAERARQMIAEIHDRDRAIDKLKNQLASSSAGSLLENAKEIDGIRLISAYMPNTDVDSLKAMSDKVKEMEEPTVAVISGSNNGKVTIVAAANKAAQALGVKAGQVVREVAIKAGGKGGGKPDFAMAGVKSDEKIQSALDQLSDIVDRIVKE